MCSTLLKSEKKLHRIFLVPTCNLPGSYVVFLIWFLRKQFQFESFVKRLKSHVLFLLLLPLLEIVYVGVWLDFSRLSNP